MKVLQTPPDPTVLFYTKEDKDGGPIRVATIESIIFYNKGMWRALFCCPGMPPETIDQHNSPLGQWEAIYAVTDEEEEEFISRIAQRVVAVLQEQGASPSEIVGSGTAIAMTDTIDKAMDFSVKAATKEEKPYVCDSCNKKYVYAKALTTHMKKAHSKAVLAS